MILSIESSCDDSSIAVTDTQSYALHFHKKISQDKEHSIYGGVVPELASRLHAVALPKILEQTKPFFPDLKAIAVTNEPGLNVTLMEGVMMAKALSLSLSLPLIATDHLKAHIYSLFIEKETVFPVTALLVSGGHTMIIEMLDHDTVSLAGSTMDDSFGESFDKVAKMLDLGYPGGPVVESYAQKGDESRFDFTIPLSQSPMIAYSFSGLKNAVRLAVEQVGNPSDQDKYDICASFQKTATAHILQKLKKYFRTRPPRTFAIVGGASANGYLRGKVQTLCEAFGADLLLAPLAYCSDNAAMAGRLAVEEYRRERFTRLAELETNPKSSLFA